MVYTKIVVVGTMYNWVGFYLKSFRIWNVHFEYSYFVIFIFRISKNISEGDMPYTKVVVPEKI